MRLSARILLIIILMIPAVLSFGQEAQNEKLEKAASLYSSGKYNEALDLWMSVYNTGVRSPSLEYNIGNAYFKMNNTPGAILFYERASLLKPADEDIQYNLQIARTLVVDKFVEIPELFFIRWYNFLSLTLSTNSWAKISIVTFILFLLALSLYIYSSRYRYKVTGFWTAILLLMISAGSIAFSVRNKNLILNNHKAIIFSPVVNGKSSPDSSGTDLFVLHEGSKVTINDQVGDWYEIRLSDGNKGWVPANSLEKI